jgi:hypothetical protein
MSPIRSFEDLQRELATERAHLVNHPMYAHLTGVADVRMFMEHHVFAVWDFMSLLKSLQRELTCVDVPWVPRGDATGRRLINEIVMGEESDDGLGGGYTSHFELYREAMRECGADGRPIDVLVARVTHVDDLHDALSRAQAPKAARQFVENTFATIGSRSIARIAAAFTIGREEIIPDMFTRLVTDLSQRTGGTLARFEDYLRRHIHIDGERHGPMAARLLESVCGADDKRWAEALVGARDALVARRALWDGIAAEVDAISQALV